MLKAREHLDHQGQNRQREDIRRAAQESCALFQRAGAPKRHLYPGGGEARRQSVFAQKWHLRGIHEREPVEEEQAWRGAVLLQVTHHRAGDVSWPQPRHVVQGLQLLPH